jgi:hypothetical protein
MQNGCSHERAFWSIFLRATIASRTLLLVSVAASLLVGSACLPLINPQQREADQLLDRLAAARAGLAERPPRLGATCDDVADVKSRLLGEPGLLATQPAPVLLTAADALQAVCGQATLLAVPIDADWLTPAVTAARARWQGGLTRQLTVACDSMRQAAVQLGRAAPC